MFRCVFFENTFNISDIKIPTTERFSKEMFKKFSLVKIFLSSVSTCYLLTTFGVYLVLHQGVPVSKNLQGRNVSRYYIRFVSVRLFLDRCLCFTFTLLLFLNFYEVSQGLPRLSLRVTNIQNLKIVILTVFCDYKYHFSSNWNSYDLQNTLD